MALLPRLAAGGLLLLLALAALDGKPAPPKLLQKLMDGGQRRSEDQAAAGRIIDYEDGDEPVAVSVGDTKQAARALSPLRKPQPLCSCTDMSDLECMNFCHKDVIWINRNRKPSPIQSS
uniref:Sarafotoxin-i1 n=1 Tax=Atractaspis irregularis TaxID=512568 RepID=SRTX1_ATRIR|nr:RecName: Full=Sarafotoxin-i1; Short=SRTX-i1; AltName: Full=Sarafotoxin-i3; Short=SRTX-i3; Flags: Precursor [Atractaspis irregularis]